MMWPYVFLAASLAYLAVVLWYAWKVFTEIIPEMKENTRRMKENTRRMQEETARLRARHNRGAS